MRIYNKLENLVKNTFSQIGVQLKRRYDLIPNVVETAKAYMKHEKKLSKQSYVSVILRLMPCRPLSPEK